MKSLTLLALVATFPAFANDVQNYKVAKSYDGKIAVCESDYNVGRAAYRPLLSSLTANRDSLTFNTGFASLKCTKTAQGFAWDHRLPLDPIPGTDIYGAPLFRTHSQLKYLLVSRAYGVLAELPAANEFLSNYTFSVAVKAVLTQSELAALEQGKTVQASMELFQQGLEAVHYKGETTNHGMYTGGSYIVSFTMQKSAAGYQVVDFSFR